MSSISINVEFLAGTPIEHAIGEAKIKASLWNVAYVCFKFNGVSMSVSQRANVDDMAEEYRSVVDDKYPHICG